MAVHAASVSARGTNVPGRCVYGSAMKNGWAKNRRNRRARATVEMSPNGRRHRAFVDNLNQLLTVRVAGRAIVSVQNPVVLDDDTEPEPDIQIIRRRSVPYKELEPHGNDVLLIIEVAETSLSYDRSTKLRLYVETGIAEYWVVDCAAESVEVHRTPDASGYRDVSCFTGTASISPLAFPDVRVTLAEIFA